MEVLARDLGLPELPGFTRNLFTDRDLIDGFLKLHGACDGPQPAADRNERMIATFGRLFARYGRGRRLAGPVADRELLRRAATHMHRALRRAAVAG